MLGPQDKTKIVAPGFDSEGVNKIIVNEEKEMLYGSVNYLLSFYFEIQ